MSDLKSPVGALKALRDMYDKSLKSFNNYEYKVKFQNWFEDSMSEFTTSVELQCGKMQADEEEWEKKQYAPDEPMSDEPAPDEEPPSEDTGGEDSMPEGFEPPAEGDKE